MVRVAPFFGSRCSMSWMQMPAQHMPDYIGNMTNGTWKAQQF